MDAVVDRVVGRVVDRVAERLGAKQLSRVHAGIVTSCGDGSALGLSECVTRGNLATAVVLGCQRPAESSGGSLSVQETLRGPRKLAHHSIRSRESVPASPSWSRNRAVISRVVLVGALVCRVCSICRLYRV